MGEAELKELKADAKVLADMIAAEKEALKDVNDPERLKGVIGYIEDTEEQMVDLDDEGVRSTFGFTRLQRKHLLSDLKKRFIDIVRKH